MTHRSPHPGQRRGTGARPSTRASMHQSTCPTTPSKTGWRLALFWLMALAVFLQFFTRYVLNDSFAWTEEIATNCTVALVFVGSAMCVRMSRHIQVDFLYRYLPARRRAGAGDGDRPRPHRLLRLARDLVWQFMASSAMRQMTTISLPKNLVYWLRPRRLRPDVLPRRSGRRRQLAAGLFGARAAGSFRRTATRQKPDAAS